MGRRHKTGAPRTTVQAPSSGSVREHVISAVVCIAAVVGFLAVHGNLFFETWTDENIHVYVARRISEGCVLYRDIHRARPPLALAPLAMLLRLGFAPLLAARATVVLAVVCIATALLWAGRQSFSPGAGVAAFALFLAAPEVSARSTFTGIHLVALWSTLCALLALSRRPLSAGICAAMALATGQHAAVIVALSGIVILLRRPRDFAIFVGGFGAVIGVIFGTLVALGGSPWIDLVSHHLYHFGNVATKAALQPADSDVGWYLPSVSLDNLTLIALAFAALPLAKRGMKIPTKTDIDSRWVLACIVLAHVTVVTTMRGALILYLFPALPLLALLAAEGLVRSIRWLNGPDDHLKNRRDRWVRVCALFGVFLTITLGGWALSNRRYQERDHKLYPLVPYLRYIAMAQVQRLTVLDAIASYIGPDLSERDTVFGYPTIASAVAVRLGRRVAAEQADLAPRWIRMGLVNRHELVDAIEADRVRYFITPKLAFLIDPFFQHYLAKCYDKPMNFPRRRGVGNGIPDIYIFRHRDNILCRANRK